jgi:hypothetical protein
MTDIGNWPDFIEKKNYYIVVPLNEYQMGNLLDALTQAQDNGDWWHELQDIIGVAMQKFGIETLSSNRGAVFTRKQVQNRNIMTSVKPQS